MTRFFRATLALTFVGSLASASVAQALQLFPGQQFNVGGGANSPGIADVNGDGFPDLVTANFNSSQAGVGTLSVMLGTEAGGFGAPSSFSVGEYPKSVAIADLNGDGKLDLATATGDPFQPGALGTVTVLLGTGTGSFAVVTNVGVASVPSSVQIADLNGDSNADLVAAKSFSNSAVVLFGTGTGTFGLPTTLDLSSTYRQMALGDVNGDTNIDVVAVIHGSNSVAVRLGAGDGSFGPSTAFGVGENPHSLAIGDLDGDGIRDLVTTNSKSTSYGYQNTLSILLGTGAGSFAPAITTYPFGFQIGSPAIGDIVIGDLSGDGNSDLVTVGSSSSSLPPNNLLIMLGTGGGSFAMPTTIGVGDSVSSAVICDLNRDGKSDLLTGSSYIFVTVLLGTGAGNFIAPKKFDVGNGPLRSVAIGDLSGGGTHDLVAAKTGSVSVLLGTGTGDFGPPNDFSVNPTPGSHPNALSAAIGDLDGDGLNDIVTANGDFYTPGALGTVSVLLGAGAGSFGAPKTFGAGLEPSSVAVADLDGDLTPDVVAANSGSSNISIFLGIGNGTLGQQMTLAVGAGPQSVAIGDLNADGIPDLVTANYTIQPGNPGTVSVLLATGLGTFGTPTSLQAGVATESIAIGDLNGDGKPDLAMANNDYVSNVSTMLGTGAGGFGALSTFSAGAFSTFVLIRDLSGDGKPDAATANTTGNISTLLGDGTGNFIKLTTYGVGGNLNCIGAADIDGSGTLDLVTSDGSSHDVSVLLNSLPLPITLGVVPYGTGTSGCTGQLGLCANSVPSIGNSSFAIVGSNAPRNAAGLTLVTDIADRKGSDLFGVNLLIHVALAGAIEVFTLDMSSGPSGEQFAPVPIPNTPALAGKKYFLQSFWVEPVDQSCTPGFGGLESSRGLSITIQP